MNLYFAGITVGIILIQTSIVAPSLSKTLSREDFGVAIRAIWPKFFLLVAASGVGGVISLVQSGTFSAAQMAIAGLTVVLPVICYALIPATNRATDTGNERLFKRLHIASVLFTVAVLIGNIGVLAVST